MSKLLKRALRIAVLPACLLVAGKFISLIALTTLKGASLIVDNDITSFFTVQLYITDPAVTLFANSISNFITLLLIALPTFYLLIRKTLLKDAQHNPRTVVKLTKLNVLKWVTSQDTPILDILMWTVFLWIISGISISSSMLSQTYLWIGITAGVFSVLGAWGLLRTFEMETAKIYPREDKRYI